MPDKSFEHRVRDGWRQVCRNYTGVTHSEPILADEVLHGALKRVKSGTAPGYDNIHPEFLSHLSPLSTEWLAELLIRMLQEHLAAKC